MCFDGNDVKGSCMITITGKDEFSTFRYGRVTDAWFPTVSNLHNYVTVYKGRVDRTAH